MSTITPTHVAEAQQIIVEAVRRRTGAEAHVPVSPFDPVSVGEVRVGAMPGLEHDPRTGVLSGTVLVVHYVHQAADDPYGHRAGGAVRAELGSDGSRAKRGAGLVGRYDSGEVIRADAGQVSSVRLQTPAGEVLAVSYPLSVKVLPSLPALREVHAAAVATAVARAVSGATVHNKISASAGNYVQTDSGSTTYRRRARLVGPKSAEVVLDVSPQDSRFTAYPITAQEARDIAGGVIRGLPGQTFASVGRISKAEIATSEPFREGVTRFTVRVDVEHAAVG